MKQSFELWKLNAARSAALILGISDLLDENDPYEVFDLMEPAYNKGQSAKEFINEVFAEDINKDQHYAQLLAKSYLDK